MSVGMQISYTDTADFDEVKTLLAYFAETRLPDKTRFELVYDPNAGAYYGRIKSLAVVVDTAFLFQEPWTVEAFAKPGRYLVDRGLYLVGRGITTGQKPPELEGALARLTAWAEAVAQEYDRIEAEIHAKGEAENEES